MTVDTRVDDAFILLVCVVCIMIVGMITIVALLPGL
jgi:hypothetical protein